MKIDIDVMVAAVWGSVSVRETVVFVPVLILSWVGYVGLVSVRAALCLLTWAEGAR